MMPHAELRLHPNLTYDFPCRRCRTVIEVSGFTADGTFVAKACPACGAHNIAYYDAVETSPDAWLIKIKRVGIEGDELIETVTSLVQRLDQTVPGFAGYYASDENLFDSGTFHAAFAALSSFVREVSVSEESWARLGRLVTELVDGSESELDNAAATCLLENLAAPLHPLKRHLGGRALEYWLHWEV